MKSHFHIFIAVIFLSMLTLAACSGPEAAPAPKPQVKAEESSDRPAVAEERPSRIEEPRAEITPKVRPAAKDAAKPKAAPSTPKAANVSHAPAGPVATTVSSAPSTATTSSSSSAPGTLTLPAPVGPPVAVPAPPAPAIDEKPVPVEPVTRQVRVPSGTQVTIRMIDSVDSSTAHAGETFKASLDQPIVVDSETIFPRGSDVYVKLTKVESAGRLSGKSELELQLDRIFLGKKSYVLASNTFTNTGASQGGRTARTAGLGAAIGAAIGAISGGGKGAVIGATTGAGAGVGVEAIRKGEQIRVDSETRLDFRLDEPIEVTISSSPTTSLPRNNPSGPLRFGTRQQ